MKISRTFYIYWPVLLFLSTATTAWLYDPALFDSTFPFSFSTERVIASLVSPVFWTFVLLSIGGIFYARRAWQGKQGYSDTDKMATLWFLLNATWFHTGCDIMSGLFQVMPNLTESYIALNSVHELPLYHPDRALYDAIYWFEVFIEAPLALVVAILYLRQATVRPIVESFLNGLYVAGTIAYYLPNILAGHTEHVLMSNFDRSLGAVWIVVSVGLTVRAARQLRERSAQG
jgi:hypothetical protein